MTPLQHAFVLVVCLASVATLPGLAWNGRVRECWSYLAYLLFLTVCAFCVSTWPQTFYRWDWWMAKRAVFDALKAGIAIELALRAVAAFPGPKARLQVAMVATLAASAAMIATAPGHRDYAALWAWQPTINSVTIWLFFVTALVVIYYRLPVSTWHRALVVVFSVKLFLFTVLINILAHAGWRARPWVNVADGLSDVAVSLVFGFFAWRPSTDDALVASLRRRLAVGVA
jgi:hypothetical protein